MKIIMKWILGGYTSLRLVDTRLYHDPMEISRRLEYYILFQRVSNSCLQDNPGIGVAKTRNGGRRQRPRRWIERNGKPVFTKCATHKQTTVFSINSDKEGCSVVAKNKPDAWMEEQEEFTAEQWAAVEAVIKKYKAKPGSLIPVLEEVQEAVGYLPKPVMERVALGLKVPFSEVYGVVTFYSFFTMAPKGKHTVRCCLGTACYVRGGKKILETLTETLNVQPGETTPDRHFSLETVRCLGACGLAPVVVVDEDTHRQMKPSKISGVLEAYDK